MPKKHSPIITDWLMLSDEQNIDTLCTVNDGLDPVLLRFATILQAVGFSTFLIHVRQPFYRNLLKS